MKANCNQRSRLYLSIFFLIWAPPATAAPATNSIPLSEPIAAKSIFGTSAALLQRCHDKVHSGLLVVLHGRGGHSQLETLASQFKDLACKKNLALVVPAASSANQNWPFERAGGDKQDLFLIDLIEKKIPAKVKLKKNRLTVFVGISAGATFLMGDFYPRHAQLYNGAAIALCGGSWPTDRRRLGVKENFVKFPLAIRISKRDFLFRQSEAGIKAYEERGVPVFKKITDEAGHCAFSLENAAAEALSQLKI